MRPVNDLDDVLDVNVVLFGVQSHGKAVVLPAVDRLVANCHHLPVHVEHLRNTAARKRGAGERRGRRRPVLLS